MGRTYIFSCEKCGYAAQVAGTIAEGVEIVVQTVACIECRVVADAIIGWKIPVSSPDPSGPPELDWVMRLLPSPETTRWVHFKAACPADAEHEIQEWKDPGKCPKCGVFMERSGAPFREWK